MSGLVDLPKSKWPTGGDNKILNQDWIDVEQGILDVAQVLKAPYMAYIDATSVRVQATTDSPSYALMMGFPNILSNGWIYGSSDKALRTNTSNTDFDFDVASTRWGVEKGSQWYNMYCIATATQTSFTLKAMPMMRVYSYSSNRIYVRTLGSSAAIGYGFTTDELIGYKIYFLTGSFAGYIRTISANNNSSSAGYLEYSETPILPVLDGDWFVILPNTNFRWIGDIYNDSLSNIYRFTQDGTCVRWYASVTLSNRADLGNIEQITIASPLATYAHSGNVGTASFSVGGASSIQAVVNDGNSYSFALWFCQFRNYLQTNQGVVAWWYPSGWMG